jgi:hypothetical protein
MITTAELHRAAEAEGLRFDQVGKDYVILCVLRGLARSGLIKHGWIFKGGTWIHHECLLPIISSDNRQNNNPTEGVSVSPRGPAKPHAYGRCEIEHETRPSR